LERSQDFLGFTQFHPKNARCFNILFSGSNKRRVISARLIFKLLSTKQNIVTSTEFRVELGETLRGPRRLGGGPTA